VKFRILRNFVGSQDGLTLTEFEAGQVCEISEHLAPHVSAWAVPVGPLPLQTQRADAQSAQRAARRPAGKLLDGQPAAGLA
jgi:hypothetical protein